MFLKRQHMPPSLGFQEGKFYKNFFSLFFILLATNTTSTGRQKTQQMLSPGTALQRLAIASAIHSCLITALKVILQIFKSK